MAALKLNWYKFKNSYSDFFKVIIGILLFEILIIYIQKDGFMEDFETTRMTLFLLLFSTSLLIIVQNSIFISKERAILERDFFSNLNRMQYALATLFFNFIFSIVETAVFLIGYYFVFKLFSIDFPDTAALLSNFNSEIAVTIFLTFMCSHVMALLISSLVGKSEITSVILAVVVGILQFSMAGTILELPETLENVSSFIFLGFSHKLLGMTNELENFPSALAELNVPVDENALKQFEASKIKVLKNWGILVIHLVTYTSLFILSLKKTIKK